MPRPMLLNFAVREKLAVITSKVRATRVTVPAAGRGSLGRAGAALVIGLVWGLLALVAEGAAVAQVTPLPTDGPLKRLTPALIQARLKAPDGQPVQGEEE